MTALHLAAKAGHLNVVKFFLNTGKVNINVTVRAVPLKHLFLLQKIVKFQCSFGIYLKIR